MRTNHDVSDVGMLEEVEVGVVVMGDNETGDE